ncbi:MAG: hypothetical protein RLZZ436_1360, partial [Planctomycetota bacterium]
MRSENAHEPPGGSPRVKSSGNALLTLRAVAVHQGAESQPGASARPLRKSVNAL